ncbi:MAG: glycosyl hydrolase family 43 [Sphingobacteriales bacterium]|nr:MAG: glycosyl hydrolase family 43 [Sphingobacteriales bacterium]
MQRKDFIKSLSILTAGSLISNELFAGTDDKYSNFSKKLKPIGRALELEGYYVWCNSPIQAADGKIHLFFSRWKAEKKMSGWINGSEIAHAIADNAESEFKVTGTIIAPRGAGYWDATTCHNPLIKKLGEKYYLYYMGNSNGKTNTKRIGVAVSNSLEGPWTRSESPILLPGEAGTWDDHCTTNPAVIQHTDGKYWLYYKSWNTKEYEDAKGTARGNRKYGLAFSNNPEGPFTKYEGNPIIDFSAHGNNAQFEDAFIWQQNNRYHIIARDMGFFNHENGLILQSKKGIQWSEPKIAYEAAAKYFQQPPAPAHLKKYGRFERPQILFIKGKPAYLFTTTQGGKYMTASPFIFKLS